MVIAGVIGRLAGDDVDPHVLQVGQTARRRLLLTAAHEAGAVGLILAREFEQ